MFKVASFTLLLLTVHICAVHTWHEHIHLHINIFIHTQMHTHKTQAPLAAVVTIWTLTLLISVPFAWALSKAQHKLPVGTHFAPSALTVPLHRVPTPSAQCARLQLLKHFKVLCNIETNRVKYAVFVFQHAPFVYQMQLTL